MKKYVVLILLTLSLWGYGQQVYRVHRIDTITAASPQVYKLSHDVVYVSGVTVVDYNALADSLFARMTAQPPDSVKEYISEAYDSLQFYNLVGSAHDTLDFFQMYAMHDAQSSLLDWKRDTSATVSTAVTFTPYVGYAQNIASNYIDTKFNAVGASKYKQNNASIGFYTPDGFLTSLSAIGTIGTNYSMIYGTGLILGGALNNNTYYTIVGRNTTIHGLTVLNRTAAANFKSYRNGTLFNTNANASTGVPTRNFLVMTHNNASPGGTAFFSRATASFGGAALSATQLVKINEICDRYMDHLGTRNTNITGENTYVTWEVEPHNKNFNFKTLAINGRYRLAVSADSLYFSSDSGATYSRKIYSAINANIVMAHVFPNKNMIWCTGRVIYASYDSLGTIATITPTDGGSAYTLHTPSNASYPGDYYKEYAQGNEAITASDTLYVWGNYGQVFAGANPTNIYYTSDCGRTIKVGYKFGQNPYYRDNGTATPGVTGNLLGDATNTICVRHVHHAQYRAADGCYYVCTGDQVVDSAQNVWMKGTYTEATDSWVWSEHISMATDGNRFITTNIYFEGDSVIWLAETGFVYKSHYTDLKDINKLKTIKNFGEGTSNLSHYGTKWISTDYLGRYVWVSNNFRTWNRFLWTGFPLANLSGHLVDYDGIFIYPYGGALLSAKNVKIRIK